MRSAPAALLVSLLRRVALACSVLALPGCIWLPSNYTVDQESTATVSIEGYAASGGAVVTISARNANTGNYEAIGTRTSDPSWSFSSPPYNLYHWAYSSTVNSKYWAPTLVPVNGQPRTLNGLPTSAGQLELQAATGTPAFATFTDSAKQCLYDHVNAGETITSAGSACSDGKSLVMFDNNAVGSNAQSGVWTTDYTGLNPPMGTSWEIGHYSVQNHTIYGFMCRPTGNGPFRTAIVNHGGFGPVDDTFINNYCILPATQGWVVWGSVYRGETIQVTGDIPHTSWGVVEVCQGEVTDVLELTRIARLQNYVNKAKLLMWGYSHGACITERAVQRGAKVTAAAAIAAPADMRRWYDDSPDGGPGASPCNGPGSKYTLPCTFGDFTPAGAVRPLDSPIPYDWRSPASYPAELAARKDVKFLLIQGGNDLELKPVQVCKLAANAWGNTSFNWHFDTFENVVSPAAPATCSDYPQLAWRPTPAPSSLPGAAWPADKYVLVFDGATHATIMGGTPFAMFNAWANYQCPLP